MTANTAVTARRRLGAGYCEHATLSDGTPILLRPISSADGPLLQLGLLLLSRLREAALERNVTRFIGSMLEENRPMRGLLRKVGGRVGLASRGVCEVDLG